VKGKQCQNIKLSSVKSQLAEAEEAAKKKARKVRGQPLAVS